MVQKETEKKYEYATVEDVLGDMSEMVGTTHSDYQGKSLDGDDKQPERILWRKYRKEIDVHAQGYLLRKIMELRPNENDDSLQNRLLNYEPITTPHWVEAITRIQRIISASSVDVQESPITSDYVKGGNFDGLSLYDFFALNICEKTINNPNGLIAVYPIDIAKEKGINPIQFVEDREIVYFDGKTAVFLCLNESDFTTTYDTKDNHQESIYKSAKTYNIEIRRIFRKAVYHVFTQTEFATVEQSENSDKWTGTAFKTGLDFCPVMQLGGEKTPIPFVYKSFFHNAIHYGNKALNRASDDDAVQSMYAYPIVEMSSDECHVCNGLGYTKKSKGGFGVSYEQTTCETCKGSGEIVVRSPYKVMMRKRQKSNTDPIDNNVESVRFYNPDIGILTHSADNWQQYLDKYKRCLYLIDRRDTKGVESGSSIEQQYAPLYDFLHKIGLTLFGNLEVILTALQKYLDPEAEKPTVTRPISYHLIEEGEAFNVLATFLSGATPLYLRRQYIKNFVSKYIGMSSPILRVIEAMENIDPFFYYTLEEKTSIKMTGAMNQEQYVFTVGAFGVMGQVLADPANKEATKEQLAEKIKAEISKWKIDPVQAAPTGQPIGQPKIK